MQHGLALGWIIFAHGNPHAVSPGWCDFEPCLDSKKTAGCKERVDLYFLGSFDELELPLRRLNRPLHCNSILVYLVRFFNCFLCVSLTCRACRAALDDTSVGR